MPLAAEQRGMRNGVMLPQALPDLPPLLASPDYRQGVAQQAHCPSFPRMLYECRLGAAGGPVDVAPSLVRRPGEPEPLLDPPSPVARRLLRAWLAEEPPFERVKGVCFEFDAGHAAMAGAFLLG